MFVGFNALGAHKNSLDSFTNNNFSLLKIRFPVSEGSLVRVTNLHSNNFLFSTLKTNLHDNLQAKNSTIYQNYKLKIRGQERVC